MATRSPSRSKPAAARPVIHPFDERYGTDTSGLIPGTSLAEGTGIPPADLTAYYAVAPSILHSVIDLWLQHCAPQASIEETVFLDVGAGKGRAILLASQYPFLQVTGIELNSHLAAVAARNIAVWNQNATAEPLSPLTLVQGDACRQPLPPEPTLAYLFHPFEDRLLRRFLRHVTGSLSAVPRPFDLVYVNAEHNSMLDREPALQRLWVGKVPMSPADHVADLAAIAEQKEYGSTGDELCAIYRVCLPSGKRRRPALRG